MGCGRGAREDSAGPAICPGGKGPRFPTEYGGRFPHEECRATGRGARAGTLGACVGGEIAEYAGAIGVNHRPREGRSGVEIGAAKGRIERRKKGSSGGIEDVGAHVEAVGPDAEFGVIGKRTGGRGAGGTGVHLQSVQIPASVDGVIRFGSRDALVDAWFRGSAGGEGEGEMGENPTVGKSVVEHDGVAEGVSVALGGSYAGPEGIFGEGGQSGSGCFVVNGVGVIDGEDEVFGAHVAVGVGRITGAGLTAGDGVVEVEAGEVGGRGGGGGVNGWQGKRRRGGTEPRIGKLLDLRAFAFGLVCAKRGDRHGPR